MSNQSRLLTLSKQYVQMYPTHSPLAKINDEIDPRDIISIAQERDNVSGLLILTVYYIDGIERDTPCPRTGCDS